jgi:hypothetical protein
MRSESIGTVDAFGVRLLVGGRVFELVNQSECARFGPPIAASMDASRARRSL